MEEIRMHCAYLRECCFRGRVYIYLTPVTVYLIDAARRDRRSGVYESMVSVLCDLAACGGPAV